MCVQWRGRSAVLLPSGVQGVCPSGLCEVLSCGTARLWFVDLAEAA